MVFDSERDRQNFLHVLKSFPMQGPFGQILEAIEPLKRLYQKASDAAVGLPKSQRVVPKEVKK